MSGPGPHGLPVLVTGVTGYVGSLLVPRLLAEGWRVRVLVRDRTRLPETLPGGPRGGWVGDLEVVEGDAAAPGVLDRALDGVGVAYYLLHSMDGAGDYVRRDRELAGAFARSAMQAGVRRIVYLGGIHPPGVPLSAHLGSRAEVGRILLDSSVPTAVLQAGVIVGAGSASFEMLRHLTERLPVMVAPRWLRNRIQPIAADDALHYLVGAACLPDDVNRTFDIGGPEVLTYAAMMQRYAAIRGLAPRLIVTVPVLTPWLASHWVGLVTPVSAGIAKPLVGSLVHEVVCAEHDIDEYLPSPPGGGTGFDQAVRLALAGRPG